MQKEERSADSKIDLDTLAKRIRKSLVGQSIPNSLRQSQLTQNHQPIISKREYECLECLLKGMTAKETGLRLHISQRTVESHIGSIKQKFHCDTVMQLMSKLIMLVM